MTVWLDNPTLAHLRDVADWPDLGDRYEVRGRLGRGGMGAVYEAHDRVLDREVAVKVLDDVAHAAEASRLVREARILGQLEHPGIVPVHDAGTLPDGRAYYVMKRVRGEPLEAAARARSPNERLELFLRICDTVAFAHARGIVHRDLKPDNIMLGAFGEVLVMDWGVARSADAAASEEAGAAAIGTPGYMAPEQGRDARQADHRADVYALGIILAALMDPVEARPLKAIVSRASAEHVEARYAAVTELARDVMRFRDGQPIAAYQESVLERGGRLFRRHQLPIVLVLVYMAIRVILLLWSRT